MMLNDNSYRAEEKELVPPDFIKAHRHSIRNRTDVLQSKQCGCFHCLRIFTPAEICEWVNDDLNGIGQTAICPYCPVNSVIGSSSGFPITVEFLRAMHAHWF